MIARTAAGARRLAGDRQGGLLVELALALPVLMLILLGGVEVGRYVLLSEKLDRVAATMSDLAAQAETLSAADLDNLFLAVEHVARPFEMGANGVVIVSSVGADATATPRVNWQRQGGGTLAAASRIGSAGGTAALPAGFRVRSGETAIVAEVVYDYVPWILGGVTEPAQLYHSAFYRPRLGTLSSLD